jgi:hypothetical protein
MARRGVVHGETAARRARQLAARRHAHKQGQGKKTAHGGGMATALTAGRRCSRRRLGVGGGAASVSMFTVAPRPGPAPPRSRTAPPSSGSSRPRHSVAATRRRRRGSPAFTAPPPLLLPSPFLFPFGGAALERGKTPMWVGGGGRLLLAFLLLLLNPRHRKAWRKPSAAPAGSARAPVAAPPASSLRIHGHRVTVRG